MASLMRRAMVYLGLVDDEYDDVYEGPYEDAPPNVAAGGRPLGADGFEPQASAVRALPRDDGYGPGAAGGAGGGSAGYAGGGAAGYAGGGGVSGVGTVTPRPAVVRSITPLANARVHVVVGKDFNDAKEIGDTFRKSQPVIVNLQSIERDLRRRMVDFCSGLTYGLDGKMKQVAEGVLLLTPSNVEVSEEEKRRLQERGYRT